jgi:hypothetical protein
VLSINHHLAFVVPVSSFNLTRDYEKPPAVLPFFRTAGFSGYVTFTTALLLRFRPQAARLKPATPSQADSASSTACTP